MVPRRGFSFCRISMTSRETALCPWNVPASSDYPHEEVTVQIKYGTPKQLNGKTLTEILNEAKQTFLDVFIWDLIGVQGYDDDIHLPAPLVDTDVGSDFEPVW